MVSLDTGVIFRWGHRCSAGQARTDIGQARIDKQGGLTGCDIWTISQNIFLVINHLSRGLDPQAKSVSRIAN